MNGSSPDEIVGLIERLMMASGALADRGHVSSPDNTLYAKAASALRALAQENEKLRLAVTNKNEACQELADRIRELEAERDAIRRKTIEECHEAARIAMQQKDWMNEDVLDAIRALA